MTMNYKDLLKKQFETLQEVKKAISDEEKIKNKKIKNKIIADLKDEDSLPEVKDIPTSSSEVMYKGKTISIPKKEIVNEHKELVRVLESKSHKDDIKEAKEQGKELKRYMKKGIDSLKEFVKKTEQNQSVRKKGERIVHKDHGAGTIMTSHGDNKYTVSFDKSFQLKEGPKKVDSKDFKKP